MGIQTKIIALLIALLALAGAVLGYGHYQFENGVKLTSATYEAALSKQKVEAARKLADALIDVAKATQALNDFHNSQELKDASNQKYNHDLADRLRNATGASGRLRDPNQARCGSGSGNAPSQTSATTGDRPDDSAQTGGLFSEPATELLERITAEADAINLAYRSCYATEMNEVK